MAMGHYRNQCQSSGELVEITDKDALSAIDVFLPCPACTRSLRLRSVRATNEYSNGDHGHLMATRWFGNIPRHNANIGRISELESQRADLLEALKAIQKVTADDEDKVGDERWRELWALADKWDIYHADLSDAERLITRIAAAAIAKAEAHQ